jgi:hypothetical protein
MRKKSRKKVKKKTEKKQVAKAKVKKRSVRKVRSSLNVVMPDNEVARARVLAVENSTVAHPKDSERETHSRR